MLVGWWRGLSAACAGALLLTLATLAATPVASAALPAACGSEGTSAGQLDIPSGVAVSQATGDVYVLDRKNNRVDEFTGECVFERAFGWGVNPREDNPVTHEPEEKLQVCTTATGCQAGTAGAGEGQLNEPFSLGGIAVDQTTGDVYVLDQKDGRVEKYTAEGVFVLQFPTGGASVAVGPTGTVYVGETGAVQEYDSKGEPGVKLPLEGAETITDLALNSKSEIYLTEGLIIEAFGETHPVRYYSATGEPLGVFDSESEDSARSLTLNPATGEVYINQKLAKPGAFQIRGYNATGVQVAAFATSNSELVGLAFGAKTGVLYTPSVEVTVLVVPGPGPLVSGESAGSIEPTRAVVHAVINPETGEETNMVHYRVEYGTTTGYGSSAPFGEGVLAGSFEEDQIEIPVTVLAPRKTYDYRVRATNECEKQGVKQACTTNGEANTFATLPPALVEEEFVTDVRSTSATLHASINPLGTATEYRFVYGPAACAGGECSIPVPDQAIGSGKQPVAVEQHLQGLTAGQSYHYRVTTTNTINGKLETEEGEQRSFTTETGGEAGLPDGRGWELASPPDKHGSLLQGTSEDTFVQAAADGNAVVYLASTPVESRPRGAGEITQILARRGGAGTSSWNNTNLSVAHASTIGVGSGVANRAFSPDLSLDVLQPEGSFDPALSSEASEQTPYLRDTTTGTFTPLVTHPGSDTAEPFQPFGGEEGGECLNVYCGPRFLGASPDLNHVVLRPGNRALVALVKGAPPRSQELYEWAAGKLTLVSVPPPSAPELAGKPTLGSDIGGNSGVLDHAVSKDGSRVFWTEQEAPGPTSKDAPLLFVRDTTRGETAEIGRGEAQFQGANAQGTLVFYSGNECEVRVGATGLECRPVLHNGKPLQDGNVLATSEDGAWVYFEKTGSIYVRHDNEEPKLVASNIAAIKPPENGKPQEDPWRASPDGEWFAFMSNSPLTGYDNRDAVTGQPDEEVYLYHAAAGRLVCASCNPTGARPRGSTAVQIPLAVYGTHWAANTPIAASVPGWAPFETGRTVYDPRFLSDSGRLFFNATDGLVPRDVNGRVDTYELEPPGVGGCTTATQTGTVLYSPAADGCVGLISNGESGEESVFEDASETGEDVFFLSSSRLSTADIDGSRSLWDAHTCTTASPCIPAPTSPPQPCDTEASCKASPSPQPGNYSPPASATFSGPGNLTPPPGKTTAQIKAEKLAAALKPCRHKHNRHRRQACEKRARKTLRR